MIASQQNTLPQQEASVAELVPERVAAQLRAVGEEVWNHRLHTTDPHDVPQPSSRISRATAPWATEIASRWSCFQTIMTS